MSGIYIKGMEMPTEQYGKMVITLYPNGHVAEYIGDIGRVWEAVPVPPHGDLIERDAAYDKIAEQEGGNYVDMDAVDMGLNETPTIMPADKEE